MKKHGRPSSYTPEIAREICERLAAGESLRSICRDAHMPPEATVRGWHVDDVDGFSAHYLRAREIGYDALAEEALEIANTPVEGVRFERSSDGFKEVRDDMLGHRKLQVDTRLRLLAKWSPKKYGDRQQVDLGGQLAVTNMTEDEMRAELAALAASGVIPVDQEAGNPDEDISDLL